MIILDKVAKFVLGAGNMFMRAFLEIAMRQLSMTLWCSLAIQARASESCGCVGRLQLTNELLPQTNALE